MYDINVPPMASLPQMKNEIKQLRERYLGEPDIVMLPGKGYQERVSGNLYPPDQVLSITSLMIREQPKNLRQVMKNISAEVSRICCPEAPESVTADWQALREKPPSLTPVAPQQGTEELVELTARCGFTSPSAASRAMKNMQEWKAQKKYDFNIATGSHSQIQQLLYSPFNPNQIKNLFLGINWTTVGNAFGADLPEEMLTSRTSR